MTTQEFKTIATKKMANLSTADLINEVKKLSNDFSDSAMIVSNLIMDILIDRIEEKEFVKLCNEI